MGADQSFVVLELDYRPLLDDRARMGHSAGPTDLPHRCDHGRPCQVHRHGYDLESARERRWELLCNLSRHQFGVADHPVFTVCLAVHQRHWWEESVPVAPFLWNRRNLCSHCESVVSVSPSSSTYRLSVPGHPAGSRRHNALLNLAPHLENLS